MNRTIGLVVALRAEARGLIGHGRWERGDGGLFRRFHLDDGLTLTVARSGMGPENALAAARWLIREGAAALGVAGVSGGLDPGLLPGDLILADAVMADEAGNCGQVWEEALGFVERAYRTLTEKGIPAHRGPIIGVQTPIFLAEDKQRLFTRTSALAVDMESAAVASVARATGIPFFAFRAVCDAAGRSVSQDLFLCLDEKARLRPLFLIRKMILRPAFILELLQMRRDFAAALACLRRAWRSGIRETLPSLLS